MSAKLSLSRKKLPLRSSSRILQPVSPKTARINKSRDRATIEEALDEILEHKALNGGIVSYGVIGEVIASYNIRGHHFVNRNSIDYRLQLRKDGIKMKSSGNRRPASSTPPSDENRPPSSSPPSNENRPPSSVSLSTEANSSMSTLTCPLPAPVVERTNKGGRKVGTTL